jgi:general secretion pathway protein F
MDTPMFKARIIRHGTAAISEIEFAGGSVEEIRQTVEAEGSVIVSLTAVKEPRTSKNSQGGKLKPRALDLSWWCREMATLLRAGMTVVEAVETMQMQSVKGVQEEVQTRLLQGLQQGKALSTAMSECQTFPRVLIASVIACERTGRLIEALEDFIGYQDQLRALQKKSISAAIYPAMVVTIGMLILLFLLMYVLPRFSKLFDSFQGEISGTTRLLLRVSQFMAHQTPLFLLGLAALAGIAVVAWQKGLLLNALVRVVQWFPWTKEAVGDFNRAKLYQALGLTLKGGYPLTEAMAVCESLGLSQELTVMVQQARLSIEQGHAASLAFSSAGIADPVALRLLRVGERGGQFVLVLQSLAERHVEKFTTFIQRLTTFVEPLLLLIVAMIVGGVVILMYMPIFDIASGIH